MEEIRSVRPRLTMLDVMKGLGIIFVVMVHSFCPFARVFAQFVIVMFFMISGFCWNDRHAKSWQSAWEMIRKRFFDLMLPYILCMFVFLLLQNGFVRLHLLPGEYSLTVKGFFTSFGGSLILDGGAPFLLTLWFFYVLFLVYVIHVLVCRLAFPWIGTERAKRIFYLLLVLAAALFLWLFRWVGNEFAICLSASYLAYLVGIPVRMLYNRFRPDRYPKVCFGLFLVMFTFLYAANGMVEIDVRKGVISSVLLYLLFGILGFAAILCLSIWLENVKKLKGMVRGLSFLGRSTKPIMICHLLGFKPVAALYALILGMPVTVLEQFPVLIDGNYLWMWFFYTAGGIAVSLMLNKIYVTVKGSIIHGKTK